MRAERLAMVAAAALMLLVTACGRGGAVAALVEGEAMGMRWRARVAGAEPEAVQAVAEAVFLRWERAVSLWLEDSELARFNREPAGVWVPVGEEIWAAVTLAREVAEVTDGALDVTVGPLVALWGFGSEGRVAGPPGEAEILAARGRCGWRFLEGDAGRRALRKGRENLTVNVNAVVEGLALEEVRGRLEALGYRDFLIELGGELLARGRAPDGGAWLVAVQGPGGAAGDVFPPLPLRDAALATSGTYRHRWGAEGREVSHVIDPRTGRPVAHGLASVSVLHEDCGRADALATALLVLGPERGRAVAEALGLRVFWVAAVE